MLAVKGIFQDGVVLLLQPVAAFDGQEVVVTFPDNGNDGDALADLDADWDALLSLTDSCAVDSNISDLAHQHDHYLYGKPRKA